MCRSICIALALCLATPAAVRSGQPGATAQAGRYDADVPGAPGGPWTPPDGTRPARATKVSIVNGRWHLNGAVTYPGAQAEGLLMNVRMVNAVFEDRNRPDFDAHANSDEFIHLIPD